MEKRVMYLVLVIVVAIFLGVTITVQSTQSPMMVRMINQQSKILSTLQRIDQKLNQKLPAGTQAPEGDQTISGEVAQVEAKVDRLLQIFNRLPLNQAQRNQPPAPPPEDFDTVHEIPVSHSPVKGNKEAPVTIVEFMDIQCPFCARFHPVVNEVLKAYPGKVNYIMKNFPLSFHPHAREAAKAALAAGEQGKYFEMLEMLLQNSHALGTEKYEELAGKIGLDVEKFKADLKNNDAKYEKWIAADMQLGAKVDVRGTPTYYLNGKKTNARDLKSYKAAIDAILKDK